MGVALERVLDIAGPFDFFGTLHVHKLGPGDPTCRLTRTEIVKALSGPAGSVTVAGRWDEAARRLSVALAGPGAAWMEPHVEAFFGLHDADGMPEAATRESRPARSLWLRSRGLKLARTPVLFERHAGFILQQRVTFGEAAVAWQKLHRTLGEAAPGASEIVVPLSPSGWRRVTAAMVGRLGVDLKRWTALQEAARAAPHLVSAGDDRAQLRRVLDAVRGTGPWTRENVLGMGHGDPDALPIGDLHLPALVTEFFEGVPRADDARMEQVLEPFRPHRFRLVRALLLPRYG